MLAFIGISVYKGGQSLNLIRFTNRTFYTECTHALIELP